MNISSQLYNKKTLSSDILLCTNSYLFFAYTAFVSILYNTYILNNSLSHAALSVSTVIVLNIGVFSAVTLFSKFSYVIFPVINIACAAAQYFYCTFNIPLRYKSISWVLEASEAEITSYISTKFMLFLFAGALLGVVHAYLARPLLQAPYGRRARVVLCLLLLSIGIYQFNAAIFKAFNQNQLTTTISMSKCAPTSVIKGLQMYVKEENKSQKLSSLPQADTLSSTLLFPQNEKPVIVFIIGESTRADHLSLNGYPRTTTPRLEITNGLINFGTAQSFATSTRVSLVGMLTNATRSSRTPTVGSFVSFFKKHGYRTYFYSLQNKLGRSGHLTDTLISMSDTVVYHKGQDPYLLSLLKDTVALTAENKLILLHTTGSHFSYNKNYTEEFRFFMPDQYENEDYKTDITPFINAYDNTVRKIDWMIAETIDLLKNTNAVVIYTSDHGESLGENGVMFHGGTSPEQSQVPFMIWLSDTYRKKHPEITTALHAVPANTVSHDNLFHTIISLGGISSPVIEPSLNLAHTK